jgi:hypothetical protein
MMLNIIFYAVSIFFSNRKPLKAPDVDLTLPPTSHCWERYSRIEDYELKERITLEFSGGGDDYH